MRRRLRTRRRSAMMQPHCRLAKPRPRSPACVEHRLQIERRAADHLEHLGGRRLLLERFGSSLVRACTSSNSRTFSMAITA